MRPHGEVDSKRSKPQPSPAPTTTPAINSHERRKPRAKAEARADPSPPPSPDWPVRTSRLPRIWDNRRSRLPSLAESAASSDDDGSRAPSLPPSVLPAMLWTTRNDAAIDQKFARHLQKPRGPY